MPSVVTEMFSPSDVQATADDAKRHAVTFVDDNKVAVTDMPTLQRAVAVREAIGERKKEIVARLAGPKSWADKLHKWFCALERDALQPYDTLDGYERQQIGAFKKAQDDLRRQLERDQAEQQRREEETRATLEAAALESAGEQGLADAVLAEAVCAPLPVVALPDQVRSFVSFRRDWRWRFATSEERAMQLLPREYLCVDQRKLTAYAKAMKSSAKLPGIEFYYDDTPIR
jgi:hypothetical protein